MDGRQFKDTETWDVADMHVRFGFPTGHNINAPIDKDEMIARAKFMQEELNEFIDGVEAGDITEMADALIDLVYVAKGTAVQLSLPWGDLWDDVHRCNLSKKVGTNDKRAGQKFDLIKPPGWVGPRTLEILKEYGYEPSTDHS